MPDTVDAVDRCCANVECAERELLQPRPRPGGLVFLADGLPLRPLPPSLFSSKCPSPFPQFLQVFPTQVLAFLLPTCWVRHSHHASTSPSSTLSLTRVCPPSIPPFLVSGPTFSAAAMSQLCYRRHDCRGKRVRFVGVHRRQSMLLAGLHCQHRRVLASIDVMKEHWFMRELYSWGGLTVGSPSARRDIITTPCLMMYYYNIVSVLFLLFVWCPYMAINKCTVLRWAPRHCTVGPM